MKLQYLLAHPIDERVHVEVNNSKLDHRGLEISKDNPEIRIHLMGSKRRYNYIVEIDYWGQSDIKLPERKRLQIMDAFNGYFEAAKSTVFYIPMPLCGKNPVNIYIRPSTTSVGARYSELSQAVLVANQIASIVFD